ncbi:hypothetical protein ACFQX7_09730 [Luedemannella flava]
MVTQLGVKRRDPAADRAAFDEGRTLKVLCLLWTPGKTNARGGWLSLTKDRDLVWRKTGGSEELTIPAGAALRPSDRKAAFRSMTALTLVTDDGAHDIAVRTIDADLLARALSHS